MRLRHLGLLAVAAVIAGTPVGAAHATMRDDRQDKANADVVDLKSAIVQERYAIHAIEQGTAESSKNALQALENSRSALAAVDSDAAKILYSDPSWMSDLDWRDIKTDAAAAAYHYDPYAMLHIRDHLGEKETVSTIESALKDKEKALAAASALAKPPCTELLNLQGPFMVNGVAQGEPQLTISLDCSQRIRTLKIETPSETIDTCTDPGQTCGIANGSDVTAQAGESKDPSVTLKGPALADGEEVIVEIKGDSTDYIVDEVM